MREFTNGSLTVRAFDEDVWKQERNCLYCSVTYGGGHTWLNTWVEVSFGTGGHGQIRYRTDAAGKVTIDVSDHIREVVISDSISVQLRYADETTDSRVSFSFVLAGLINPARLHAPLTAAAAALPIDGAWLAPQRIIAGAGAVEVYGAEGKTYLNGATETKYGVYVYFLNGMPQLPACDYIQEMYAQVFDLSRDCDFISQNLVVDDLNEVCEYWFVDVMTDYATAEDYCEQIEYLVTAMSMPITLDVCIPYEAEVDVLHTIDDDLERLMLRDDTQVLTILDGAEVLQSVRVADQLCGRRYAAVRWVSAAGKQKQATWEVRDAKTTTQDAVEFETADNTYRYLKGRQDSCMLFLDGLTAFDYWYYSDIVHSSSVEADFGQGWQSVEVTTKDVTIPYGSTELETLKVNIKIADYDAVSM